MTSVISIRAAVKNFLISVLILMTLGSVALAALPLSGHRGVCLRLTERPTTIGALIAALDARDTFLTR